MIFFKRCWSISSKTFSVNVYQCYFLDDVSYDFFFVRLWLGLFFCLCCLEFLVDVDWWFFFPMQFFKWWWLSFLKLTLIGVIFWLMSSRVFLTNACWWCFAADIGLGYFYRHSLGFYFGWCRPKNNHGQCLPKFVIGRCRPKNSINQQKQIDQCRQKN